MCRDHDDETNVLEAVKKLNDVKGVKGIRRYFKQVAMAATKLDINWIFKLTEMFEKK